MKYGLMGFVLAVGLLAACSGIGPASANGGGSCVMAFVASDVNGDGVVNADDAGSGAGDITNENGLACPAGWFYLGHNGSAPICQQE